MKRLLITSGVVCLLSAAALAAEQSMLARVTVYWASGGSGSDRWTRNHEAATKVRLRDGHCAVDPKRIPYGSKVILPDGTLTAVDTGGHVKSRRAARKAGHSAAQRDAIVVDRFFETKAQALAWAKKHPHFMTVRVVSTHRVKDMSTGAETRTASSTTLTKVSATKPTQPAAVAAKPLTNPVVAPVAAPVPAALAQANVPRPQQSALRTSVRTARTPAVPPKAIAATAPAGNTSPPTASVSAAITAAPARSRLAYNSSPQPSAPGNVAPAVMVHGPSHYDRRVSYMP